MAKTIIMKLTAIASVRKKPTKAIRYVWVTDRESLRLDVSAWEDFNRICDIIDSKRGQL